jgi:hypothetical protein
LVPCEKCLCLAIFKAKYNITQTLIDCDLIRNYIFGAGQGVKGTRHEKVCDFFKVKRFIWWSSEEKKKGAEHFREQYKKYKLGIKSNEKNSM